MEPRPDVVTRILQDPDCPTRCLGPFEQNMANSNYVFEFANIVTGPLDLAQLDAAYDALLKWYPVLLKTTTPPVDRVSHYAESEPQPHDFVQEAQDRDVIRTTADFYRVAMQSFREQSRAKWEFAIHVNRVELLPGEGLDVLPQDTTYIIFTFSHHVTFDGNSHAVVRNFINNYLVNPEYVPDLEHPQTMPHNYQLHVKDPPTPHTFPSFSEPSSHFLCVERTFRHLPADRGVVMSMRRFPRGTLGHRPEYSLTISIDGVCSFIYTALLLAKRPAAQSVHYPSGITYLLPAEHFKPLMRGSEDQMIGNKVTCFVTSQDQSRANSRTLDEFMKRINTTIKTLRPQGYQMELATLAGGYTDPDVPKTLVITQGRTTNLGPQKISPGPIKGTLLTGTASVDAGSVCPFGCGQPDGSNIIVFVALEVCFSQRFMDVYMELFAKVYSLFLERDVTYDELVAMPEFEEIVSLVEE